jgi:hypothetical protein
LRLFFTFQSLDRAVGASAFNTMVIQIKKN